MIFPQLAQFTDIALLLLRLLVGIVFIASGYKHLKDPATRSKDIGMSKSRRNIQGQRASQPNKKRFSIRRIIGGGDLWVTEFILTYDAKPSYTVSIMEFRGDKVARETQYFADPFVASASRAQWVERMDT
jgi:hypothetical protein